MNPSTSDWRYERKFIASDDAPTVIDAVRQLSFKQVNPPRWINNVYFDTTDLDDFSSTVEGISNRKKTRIRWYGSEFQGARLEEKAKQQLLSRKTIDSTDHASISEWIAASPPALKGRRAVLFNRYYRHYFAIDSVRLTIDEKLHYRPVNSHGECHGKPLPFSDECVIELKYAPGDEVSTLTTAIPYRLSRNSKYRNGVLLLMSLGLL